jgi:hypothetical protein
VSTLYLAAPISGHMYERERMDTISFLQKVLPDKGNYVLTVDQGSRHWNEHFDTIDALVEGVQRIDKTTATVFFAVGSFEDNIETNPSTGRSKVRRTQEKSAWFKTLACDLDVGGKHEYSTPRDAVAALYAVCDKLGLAKPMIVSSGRGVHCYWPLKQVISAANWTKLSTTLRVALQKNGLDLDPSKIHDSSMVLRPVGANHKKDPSNWKPVRLLADAPEQDVMTFATLLSAYKGEVVSTTKPNKKRESAVMSAILEGGTPIDLDSIRKKCRQIDALLASGGEFDAEGNPVSEPLWRAGLGMANYAADKEDAVIRLGGKHPDFDLEANLKKMANWKGTGPTTCAMFKQLCPGGCEGCEQDGKITSPAQLTSGVSEVVMVNPETQAQITFTLPRRYSMKNGAVYYTPPGSDEDVFVSPYMMYVLDRFTDVDENRQIAKLLVKFPLEGERVVDVDSSVIAVGGSDLVKALALRQIYIPGDPRPLRTYLMTYLQELQKTKPIEMYYRHFGWQADDVFLGSEGVMGNVDKTALTHYDGPIRDYTSAVTNTGADVENWVRLTRLFAQPDARYHGLVFLMMAGSPLMRGSGLASTLVNSYSKESGSGKTITARLGLSIWGQPSKLMRTVNDTDNALYKHFGIMHSLGAYIDEITTMDPERLRAFAFTLQEGRERDRVKQSADGFREKVTWQMPLFASSNRDAYDVVGMRYSSEAEKLRILQFNFDKLAIFERTDLNIGYKITRYLETNHGFIGPILVKEIMAQGGPHAVFDRAYNRFQSRYNFTFTGPERFYQAMMVLADAIGEIMESLGLIEFDYQQSVRNGLEHIAYLRQANIEGEMNGMDLCFQFLTENADKIVHYREVQVAGTDPRVYVMEPPPRVAVARTEVALSMKDEFIGGELFVNRQAFKKWCQFNGVEYRSVLQSMQREGVRVTEQIRKTLFKGVNGASASGQTYCFCVDLSTHPRFIEANSMTTAPTMDVKPRLAAVE